MHPNRNMNLDFNSVLHYKSASPICRRTACACYQLKLQTIFLLFAYMYRNSSHIRKVDRCANFQAVLGSVHHSYYGIIVAVDSHIVETSSRPRGHAQPVC